MDEAKRPSRIRTRHHRTWILSCKTARTDLVTEFDNNATGSGTLDLQAAGVSPTGSYAFSFSGSDTRTGNAAGTVGSFTSGNRMEQSTGLEDVNDDGIRIPNQIAQRHTRRRSIVDTFDSADSGICCARHLTSFAIDATHLKFIEMDGGSNLVGDAYSQTSTAFPTGTLAFTFQGSNSRAARSPAAAGGFMVTDGAGNITSASSVDANIAEQFRRSRCILTGTYASAGTGRYALPYPASPTGVTYVAYPFNGGVFYLETDDSGVMLGAALSANSNDFGDLGRLRSEFHRGEPGEFS